MDDIIIYDIRARDIRIWQINSQNFRVRKTWKTWFLDMGAFSWQNATYTIQFILTIYINSKNLMLPGRCTPVEFFSWKLRKTAKSGYPALIWLFRTSLFSALSWNKISHMKLQSLKMFKTTKDMFYKQFDFFLRIDRVDYGASWILSFAYMGKNGQKNNHSFVLFYPYSKSYFMELLKYVRFYPWYVPLVPDWQNYPKVCVFSSKTPRLVHLAQLGASLTVNKEMAGSGPGPATYFRGDLSWNNYFGHSPSSADSRRADVRFWQNVR